MADALTISVGADSSKLRADLAVATANVRNLGKELNAAAKAALASHDTGAVSKLAGEYDEAAAHAGELKKAMQAVGRAHHEAAGPLKKAGEAAREVGHVFKDSFGEIRESFAKLKESFAKLGENLFGEQFKAAAALGVGASVAGLYEFVHSSAEAAENVENMAQSLGLGIAAFQGLRYAAEQAGVEEEQFEEGFTRLAREVQKEALAQRQALVAIGKQLYGDVSTTGVTVLRGGSRTQAGGVSVLRGGGAAGAQPAGPRLISVNPNTLRAVTGAARLLKTTLDQAGVGANFTFAQIRQQIAMTADSVGPAAEKMRAQLRLFGANLMPRTVGEALDQAQQGWMGKLYSLGVAVLDPVTGKMRRMDAIVGDLADKFKAMAGTTKEVALAQQFFGRRAGLEMIPLLNRGRAGIDALMKKFAQLGIAFDENDTKVGREAAEAFRTLQVAVQGVKNQLALVFDPIFTPLIDTLTEAVYRNAKALKAWAQEIAARVQPVIDDLIHMLKGEDSQVQNKWLLQMRDGLREFVKGVRAALPKLAAAFKDFGKVLGFVAKALNHLFGTDFNASSIGLFLVVGKLIGAFGALRLAIGLAVTVARGLVVVLAAISRLLVAPALAAAAESLAAGFGAVGTAVVTLAGLFGLPVVAVAAMAVAIVLAIVALVAAIVIYRDQIAAGFVWLWDHVKSGAVAAWEALKSGFSAFFHAVWTGVLWLYGLFEKLLKFLKSIAHFIASVFSGGAAAASESGGAAAGYASGGYVRGPGSATSDSIPARLSHGEFVMSARSVRNWGAGFMSALNNAPGFALGGLAAALPSAPLHLAGGGLAAASGGRGSTINLTIGEHSFAGLSAPDHVAGQIQRFARSRQMTAGGVKPSWYGS